jgi:hypothetical protein
MRFTVEQKVLQAVLNYLAEKPFKETHGLIQALQADVRQDPNSPPDEAPAAPTEATAETPAEAPAPAADAAVA